jgi:enoyl-CoA hydratase/carnithine racemase
VATIWFDRPQARNAMTCQMYKGLAVSANSSAAIEASVWRSCGVGGKAFIAGTDIAQFQECVP